MNGRGGRRIVDLIRASQRPDSAIETSRRIADSYACEAIYQEGLRRFGAITTANAEAWLTWQGEALREIDRTVPR